MRVLRNAVLSLSDAGMALAAFAIVNYWTAFELSPPWLDAFTTAAQGDQDLLTEFLIAALFVHLVTRPLVRMPFMYAQPKSLTNKFRPNRTPRNADMLRPTNKVEYGGTAKSRHAMFAQDTTVTDDEFDVLRRTAHIR